MITIPFFFPHVCAMAERVGAEQLDGLSKKELVVLVQSVAPLELLQTNQLSGKPENVAKKATKEKIIEVLNNPSFCSSNVNIS